MLFRLSLIAALLLALLTTAVAGVVVAASAALPRSELAYVGFQTGTADIYVYDTLRARTHNLTASDAWDLSPSWSPDGSEMAFVSDRDGGLQVYVMDANGRNLRRVTPSGIAFEYPRWTADGEQLSLIARGNPLPDTYIVNPDGSGFQLVAEGTFNQSGGFQQVGPALALVGGPASPVGTGFLSVEFTGTDRSLLLSPAEGEPGEVLAALGQIAGDATAASWSPDGRLIAFLSAVDGQADLYLIEAWPGAQQLRLTNDSAYERSPVWRP
ncbi:MAG TPA: hypothetical protein VER79_04440 [Candidatus Limnocylindrales bacterium]|nr:hypothetical protein [Candidatus Limnocylindrales bacterium]